MEHILLPSTIKFEDTEESNVVNVVFTPCHQGYGTTIGNALRRVLLSSIPGAAVEAVKIQGVQHEFSAIEGVQEDMVEVILNLKELALLVHSEQPVRLSLSKKGKGDITAADFEKNADVEIINEDLKIATLNDDSKPFEMEIIVGNGLGYVTSAQKDSSNLDLGTVLTDSFYSPVKDVGYKVENTRVGDITDYEKLTLTITTNATISPKEALGQATKLLMDHFSLLVDASDGNVSPVPTLSAEKMTTKEDSSEEAEA